MPGEGGHVDFAPNSEEEGHYPRNTALQEIVMFRQSACFLSWAVNCIAHCESPTTACQKISSQKDITERAPADSCTDCRRALSLFCVNYGRFGGNLALTPGNFRWGFILQVASCHVSLEFFKPPVSVPH
ncbi:glucokinase [Escherichia coli]|nr:glucokinase [Escherichia coli]